MERKFDERMADCIREFTREFGGIVRECRAYEADLLAEIDTLKSHLARMTAKLQGVRDQVMDVPDDLPTVDQIVARGTQHTRVNDDIRESMARIENGVAAAKPVRQSRGLSMLLNKLRENETRAPLEDFPEELRRVEA